MHLESSSVLQNGYQQAAMLAKASGEPVFIMNEGKADLVILSVEAYEDREKMLGHRADILESEFSRLAGAPTCTVDEVRAWLEEKYANAQTQV